MEHINVGLLSVSNLCSYLTGASPLFKGAGKVFMSPMNCWESVRFVGCLEFAGMTELTIEVSGGGVTFGGAVVLSFDGAAVVVAFVGGTLVSLFNPN